MSDGEFLYVHQPSQMDRPTDGSRLIGEPDAAVPARRVSRARALLIGLVAVVIIGGFLAWVLL